MYVHKIRRFISCYHPSKSIFQKSKLWNYACASTAQEESHAPRKTRILQTRRHCYLVPSLHITLFSFEFFPRKTDRIGTAREITKTDYEIIVSSARNLAFTKCDSLLLLAKRFDPFDLFGAVNANICVRSALFRFRHRCTCVGDLSASCRVFAIFLKILSRPLAREKSRYVSVISVLNRSISWMMLRIDEFYQVNCATTI